MELNPHDLVRFRSIDNIIVDSPKAQWVMEALARTPFVVVRRAPIEGSTVPVGIRGGSRNQRLAATIETDNIIQHITPEELALGKTWRTNRHLQEIGISTALDLADSILTQEGLSWGPIGSTGFELASGIVTASDNSDLDIVIRSPEFMAIDTSQELIRKFMQAPVKVDVQLEMVRGCVILAEYATGADCVMLRTIDGPRLVKNPWL